MYIISVYTYELGRFLRFHLHLPFALIFEEYCHMPTTQLTSNKVNHEPRTYQHLLFRSITILVEYNMFLVIMEIPPPYH